MDSMILNFWCFFFASLKRKKNSFKLTLVICSVNPTESHLKRVIELKFIHLLWYRSSFLIYFCFVLCRRIRFIDSVLCVYFFFLFKFQSVFNSNCVNSVNSTIGFFLSTFQKANMS